MNRLLAIASVAFSVFGFTSNATDATKVPVKSATVFKGGYAFVQHEGSVAVDEQGNVVLDQLPTPVLGTFWSYVTTEGVTLKSVVAKRELVHVERTALSLQEMIIANPGAACSITEPDGKTYSATLDDVPVRSADELVRSGNSEDRDPMPLRGSVVLLKTDAGLKVLPLERIRDITFTKDPARSHADDEYRNRLELCLDWAGKAHTATVQIGYMYVQKGLRWIPNYKVDLDGVGKANLALQATLINELTDIENAEVNLVVGVPNIAFRDMVDPMALQSVAAQVAAQRASQGVLDNNMFSNGGVLMSQAAMPAGHGGGANAQAADLGPDVANADQREELFVFTVKGISLARGERMVFPVAAFSVAYEDVYALDVPWALPADATLPGTPDVIARAARAIAEPKVMHRARLANSVKQPFTTAPALLLQHGNVLGQTLMTYTAPGAHVDLDVSTAVDIQMVRKDEEVKRTPNALTWKDVPYQRVDVQGSLTLTSFRSTPITVEVSRRVLGSSDHVGENGIAKMLNVLEQPAPGGTSWNEWTPWMHEINGIAEVRWSVTLEPQKPITIDHDWHYFWR